MFDSVGCDAAATLAAAEANHQASIDVEVDRLRIAAHWADLHAGESVDPAGLPGRQRAVQPGGDGTPTVAEFCFADLGVAWQATAGTAARAIGDALDLRHRLPRTWAAAQAGRMPGWQARRIAAATRNLTRDQAAEVDSRIAPNLGAVSFGRLLTLLEAYVYEADPDGADAAAEQAARERFLRLGRTTEHGLRLIIAKIAAGDAGWGYALATRLAEILRTEGDRDSLEVRRSKAFGLLITQPAEVLDLLCRHRHDPDDADDTDDTDKADSFCPTPDEGDEPDGHEATDHPDRNLEHDHALRQARGAEVDQAEGTSRRSLMIVPPPFDPGKARPRAIVYVHLSEAALSTGTGVARVEDVGPVLASRLRHLIGDRCQILLKPVIDLNDTPTPVDSYEIPAQIAEHLRLRQPADVFPYAAGGSRRTDLDHTLAYVPPEQGGPPGQTGVGTLGPVVRFHHRVRTHSGWKVRQPEPGTWLWRSPYRRLFLVDATGTHPLGHSPWAQRIWRAAKSPPDPPFDKARAPDDKVRAPNCLTSLAEGIVRGCIDAYVLAT